MTGLKIFGRSKRGLIVAVALVLVMLAGVLATVHLTTSVFLFTPKARYERLENKIDKAIDRNDWSKVLKLCDKLLELITDDLDNGRVTTNDVGFIWQKNVAHTKYALTLTGKLLENFFSYSEYYGFNELLAEPSQDVFLWPSAHRFLSNMELHSLALASAFNRFDAEEKPADLINIIESSIVVGDYRTPETIIYRLEQDGNRNERRQAQKYRALLADTAAINADPYYIARRALGPTNDFQVNRSFDFSITGLHYSNPYNQRAFEYTMMLALLNNDFDFFSQIETLLERFDYDHIPRHLEEAILIFTEYGWNPNISRSDMMRQSFGGLTIRQETILRHEHMIHDLHRLQQGQISEQRFFDTYQNTYQLHFLISVQ